MKTSTGTWCSSVSLLYCTPCWVVQKSQQKPQPWFQPHVPSLPLAARSVAGLAPGRDPGAQILWVPNPSCWCSTARVPGLLVHVHCLLTALVNETAAFAVPVYPSQKNKSCGAALQATSRRMPSHDPWGGLKGSQCTRRYGSLFTIAHSLCSPVYRGLHRSSSHYRGARGPQETHHDRGFCTCYSHTGIKKSVWVLELRQLLAVRIKN